MKPPELSVEERALLADLEPILRNAVWSNGAKVFEGTLESNGKWIEYPLRHPDKVDNWGKHYRITLKKDNPPEDFTRTYCAFGANELHTSIAVYRILRHLKRRGLLNIPGFDSKDV